MKKPINIIFLFIYLFIIGCGYSPLKKGDNTNFYIGNLNIQGDRSINNHISNYLKIYETPKDNSIRYDLVISTSYKKNITSKDDKGNPSNYNLSVECNIQITLVDGTVIKKVINKNKSLSSKKRKIAEKETEKKYVKNMSKLISEDIVFLLMNR
tara:strand:+ start:932 stop:1393 length:462 start_codon:yes stop_codon:yes gene_type:complete